MSYSAVLFDLDGTLLNTLEDLNLSMQHTLDVLGLPICTLEQTRQRVGNGINKLIERSLPAGCSSELFERAHAEFVTYYAAHANDHTKPYPGVPELLVHLRADGRKIAVVSNKNHEPVCNLVHQHFGDAFDVVMGVQEGIARKPAPDMVNAALGALGIGRVAGLNEVPNLSGGEATNLAGDEAPDFVRAKASNPASDETANLAGDKAANYVGDGVDNTAANFADNEAPNLMNKAPLVDAVQSNIVYVGDSEVDILTAANAGISCITVTWGFRTLDELRAAGATSLANTTEELYSLL